MAMRWIFWGFLQKLVYHESLALLYLSSHSNFGFLFAEIFIFEDDSPLSPIQGVANSAYQ
jgi:hypothetical protein